MYPLPVIPLTDKDLQYAHRVASERTGKRNNQKFNGYETDYDINYRGFRGEIAVGRFLGWEPDGTLTSGGDIGNDFPDCPVMIDLKTRLYERYPDPDLLTRTTHAHAEIFILAEVSQYAEERIRLVGWAAKEELIKEVIPVKGIKNYIVRRKDLHHVLTLPDVCFRQIE